MIKTFIPIALSLVFVLPVAAQTRLDAAREQLRDVREGFVEDVRTDVRERREGVNERAQELRQDIRERTGERKDNVQEKALDVREGVRDRVGEARDRVRVVDVKRLSSEAHDRFDAKRTDAKNRLEERRAEAKAKLEVRRREAREKIEVRRAELKDRLQKVRDERKKQIVERLHERVVALNERLTDHFLATLEKMDKVLDNVSSRADKAEEHGRDVSAARAAIVDAEGAIVAARAAVETQAGKAYSFDISTEENLRVDVGAVRKALHDDLVAVRAEVKAAHDAIRNAAVTLAQIPRVDELEVDTEEPEETEAKE